MLERARQLHRDNKQVAIVVIRLDRLGRKKAEYFKTAEELAKLGAEVHSVKDGGVLAEEHAGVLAVFAAKEVKQTAERVAEVLRCPSRGRDSFDATRISWGVTSI